jgi:hypothetical protein
MTRRTLRIRPIALCFLLAAFALLLVPAPSDAWPSICDNCAVGENHWGEPDAQCCLTGRCDFWEDLGYSILYSNMEWCTSWQNENGAGCHGTPGSCTSGGGGGGGEDDCTIQIGEYCPPSCMTCYFVL